MENLTEEIVKSRMAEPLERELKKEGVFQNQLMKMREALHKWNGEVEMTQERVEAFSCVEEAMAEYTYIYGETAYRLGYSDGMLAGMEQGSDRSKTIFSLEDMSSLISIYDAIKKLNIIMLGRLEVHQKEEGVLGTLNCIFDVIDNGKCAEIELLGEEESFERVMRILDKEMSTPDERARQLLGIK